MTTVATLMIEMAADVARLQQDMNSAAGAVKSATDKMEKYAAGAMKALQAMGIGLSVAAFAGWIKGAIDAADVTSKLSAKTGIAVKDLAGLELSYKLAGVGQDGMATSLAKLAKNMSDGNAGLRALGVNTKESNGELRGTSSVLRDVADKFAGMEDGTAKTALAMEIFGKTGAELIPLLNGGSDAMDEMDAMAKKLGLSMGKETTDNAEKFNDTMDLVALGNQGVARGIAAELLPTLTNLTGSFLESMTEGDRLKNTAAFLASGLKILYTVGVGIVEVFSTVGKTIGAVAAITVNALQGDFAGAMAIGKEAASDIGTGWAATAKQVSAAWSDQSNSAVTSAVAIMKSNKDLLGAEKAREEAAKASAAASQKAAAEAAKMAEEGAKLAASLLSVESGLTGDFAKKWGDLNAAYKAGAINLDVLVKAQAALLAQQPAMKAAYDAAVKASNEAAAARKAESDGVAEWLRAQASAAVQSLASVRDRITGLRQEEQALALSRKLNISVAEAVEKLAIARMEEAQAAKFHEGSEGWLALQKEIDARKELVEAMSTKAVREKEESGWLEIWNSVDRTAHDTFVNVLQGGQDLWSKLKNTGKSIFFDWLYQMTLKKWIFSATMSVTGTASGVAQAAMGGAGAMGSMGGMGGLANNASSLMGMFSGTGMFAGSGLTTSIGSLAGAITGLTASNTALGVSIGLSSAEAAAAASAASAAGGTSTLLAGLGSVPVYGWIAAAAVAAFMLFSDDGTPSVSTGDVVRKYDASGKQISSESNFGSEQDAGRITDSLYETFSKIQKTIMSTGGATFGFGGYSGDNNENPMSRIIGGGYVSAEFSTNATAMATEYSRAILGAIQASDMPASVASIFAALAPSSATTEQVNQAIQAAQIYIASITELSGAFNLLPFDNIKNLSWQATDALVTFGGGIGNLTSQMAGFMRDFFSEAEQRSATVNQITAALNASGVNLTAEQVGSASRADFKAYALAQDMTTTQGQKTFAALMNVNAAFASITKEAQQAERAFSSGSSGGGGSGANAASSIANAWRAITDSIWGEVKRIRGLLEGGGEAAFAAAQMRLIIATAQARAGDQDAAKSLPQLSQAFLALADTNVGTQRELQRIQGQIAGSLSDTATILASKYGAMGGPAGGGLNLPGGMSIPHFDVGTNYVPQDMLAMIHEGEAIVPRAYNPTANGGGQSDAALVNALNRMEARLQAIEAHSKNIDESTLKTKNVAVSVSHDGKAVQTQAYAAAI